MFTVDRKYESEYVKEASETLAHGGICIPYTGYLEQLLTIKKEEDTGYPKVIKIAKDLKALAKGDFSPARVITLNKPITWGPKNLPIWFKDTTEGVELQCGYKDGDKRYLSNFSLNGGEEAHGTAGGATGSGKSVFLNDIIFSACFLYAPWELNLWMSDSKIVEFRRYSDTHHIPHIKVIGATGDSNYIVSILNKFYEDMEATNSGAFSRAGVRNLKDFRKATGLTLPRHVLVMDEYQTALLTGGKNSQEITKKINLIARLGRNAGYHLFLTSQEVASEVKPILKNIRVRFCLKASPDVSEMLLGNDQASTSEICRGKVLGTHEASKNKANNIRYYVPYQSDDEFEVLGKFLESKGKEYDFALNTNSYDEQKLFQDDDLAKLIVNKKHPTDLVLGVPSFLCDDPERFAINLDCSDMDTILVYSPDTELLNRQFRAMYANALYDVANGIRDHIFITDGKETIIKGCELTKGKVTNSFKVKDTNSVLWNNLLLLVVTQKLILEEEEAAFNAPVYDDEDAKQLYIDLMGEETVSKINISRCHYFNELIRSGTYLDLFGMGRRPSEEEIDDLVRNITVTAFNLMYNVSSNFVTSQFTKKDLKPTVYHIVGFNGIKGLGRGDGDLDRFKNILMDCYDGNVTFIIYTSTTENISSIIDGVKYEILDNAEQRSSYLKCDDYPRSLPQPCAVCFDKPSGTIYSFKKLQKRE